MKNKKKKKIKKSLSHIFYVLYGTMGLLLLVNVCSAKPCRVVDNGEGGVSIIYLVQNTTFNEVQKELGLEGQSYKDMDSKDLPTREYRDAWKLDKDKIIIDETVKTTIDIKKDIPTLEERIKALEDTRLEIVK